jgi:hypothetical protein
MRSFFDQQRLYISTVYIIYNKMIQRRIYTSVCTYSGTDYKEIKQTLPIVFILLHFTHIKQKLVLQ